jgi:hypothetical protein
MPDDLQVRARKPVGAGGPPALTSQHGSSDRRRDKKSHAPTPQEAAKTRAVAEDRSRRCKARSRWRASTHPRVRRRGGARGGPGQGAGRRHRGRGRGGREGRRSLPAPASHKSTTAGADARGARHRRRADRRSLTDETTTPDRVVGPTASCANGTRTSVRPRPGHGQPGFVGLAEMSPAAPRQTIVCRLRERRRG